jgi:MYXO-CTERM domain-containing protein
VIARQTAGNSMYLHGCAGAAASNPVSVPGTPNGGSQGVGSGGGSGGAPAAASLPNTSGSDAAARVSIPAAAGLLAAVLVRRRRRRPDSRG